MTLNQLIKAALQKMNSQADLDWVREKIMKELEEAIKAIPLTLRCSECRGEIPSTTVKNDNESDPALCFLELDPVEMEKHICE